MSLRYGFTTGTAAAAAAKAATLGLWRGTVPDAVDVSLPVGGHLTIPILESHILEDGCQAAVMKDGGDDPDATHKAVIRALVRQQGNKIHIAGGSGVGVVTRPGLPVAVGQPAINPVPRAQIAQAVREALALLDLKMPPAAQGALPLENPFHDESAHDDGLPGLTVTISVDNGEDIARRTFNPRLGIVGGISILGTRGTVKPFSHKAYAATISQCLDVMRACGVDQPCLTTGGRSERFLRQAMPDIPDMACVQVADFFSYAMREAGQRGFSRLLWGVFFGKLVKQALGHRYTHARSALLDLPALAECCKTCGFDGPSIALVSKANTARQVLEDLAAHPQKKDLFDLLTTKARAHAQAFAHAPMQVNYLLFDFDGQVLHDTREGGLTNAP